MYEVLLVYNFPMLSSISNTYCLSQWGASTLLLSVVDGGVSAFPT